MYNLSNLNIGQKIKEIRKSRNISQEVLGKKINKTKATISKYEQNEIIPDAITLLEICNVLDIHISYILSEDNISKYNNSSLANPFNTNKLYVYYMTGKVLISSIIEIYESENHIKCTMYNAVKDFKNYATIYSYKYCGTIEHSNNVIYLNLKNSNPNQLEKVDIYINYPWSNNNEMFSAFIMALTPNSLPVVKRCLISTKEIPNIQNYKNDLCVTADDLSNIQKNNSWILENHNHNHFLLDFEA